MADAEPTQQQQPAIFAGARRNWPELVIMSFILLAYWFLVFITLLGLREQLPAFRIISRSLALSGATFIGFSLFSSLIFKWFPLTARFWPYRRALGVGGFVFGFLHVVVVFWAYFGFDLGTIYFSLNPLLNPIVFGTLSFLIFLVMTLTATDWAVAKLGGTRWKNIQRFVYPAFLFLVFHFLLMVPNLTNFWPGLILVLTTMAVLFGEVYWWFRISARMKFQSRGTLVGILMIVAYLIFGYLAFGRS